MARGLSKFAVSHEWRTLLAFLPGRSWSRIRLQTLNLIERRVNNDAAFRLLLEKIEHGLKHFPTTAILSDPHDFKKSAAQAGG